MGAVAVGQFSCDSCGKSYRWKPELAGRKAKCKCGAVMHCPATDPAQASEDDMYDLAPDVEAKSAPRPPVAALPVDAPTVAKPRTSGMTASGLAYRAPKDDVAVREANPLMDLWAPLFLIVGAIGGRAIAVAIQTKGHSAAVNLEMFKIGIDMVFGTIFMLIGIFVAAKSRGINFGSFPTALFKLCAISVAPSAAMDLVAIPMAVIPLFGWLIAWVIGFMLYFALIGTLFELDQEDTWYCVKVIFVVKILTALAIVGGAIMMLRGT